MDKKRSGLSPTNIMTWGPHAPKPPWDLIGIFPLNGHPSGSKKAHGVLNTSMSFLPLIRSGQPDYSSERSYSYTGASQQSRFRFGSHLNVVPFTIFIKLFLT